MDLIIEQMIKKLLKITVISRLINKNTINSYIAFVLTIHANYGNLVSS